MVPADRQPRRHVGTVNPVEGAALSAPRWILAGGFGNGADLVVWQSGADGAAPSTFSVLPGQW